MWREVKDTIEAMPGTIESATERDRLHAARCRWLLTVLYLGGLRAAEVAETRMGAFFCRRDREGLERWWLEVTGKGNKTRLVPATDELMVELARYREANGLPPAPHPGEARPIVLPIIGKEKPLSRGALHLVLKEVFGLAAARTRPRVGKPGCGARQRVGALAAPYRRVAHDRPASGPAVREGQFRARVDFYHQRLPAHRRRCAA